MSEGEQILTLADGTVIDMSTGRPQAYENGLPSNFVHVPSNQEAVQEVTRVRKKLSDLPDVPEKLNTIGVIAAYYLFGLDDWEIAHAVGCTERQVTNIKMTQPFTEMIDGMRVNMMEGQQEDVRSMLTQGARQGARVMLDAMTSQSEQNRIVAAKDIMDRAGFRPADVVEHNHRVDGGLTIEYVKKGGEEAMPVIDISVEDEQA